MLVSEYLNSIENTPQEKPFIENTANLKEAIEASKWIPFACKVLVALAALSDIGSITAFRKTKYYDHVKNWNIEITDAEKGYFNITPGPAHKQILWRFIAIAAAVLLLLWLCKRCRKAI